MLWRVPIHAGFHSRGYLPHLKVPGAAYFVTFRLSDSLPREVIRRLKEQREDLLRRAIAVGEVEIDSRRQELFRWYATEIDSLLDQHTGAAWLRDERIASLVAGALRHFDAQRYLPHSWCVMPNHVHAVVRPLGGHSLDEILHSWKSYTASKANELLGRKGQPFWQHESYDHWIRDDTDFQHCCSYTEENPVKARLVANPAGWRWSSAFGR